ncbi:GvpL/GvpF family gas vesicle protein [Streptomyces griseolus]|uniref:GvpL/GvpF family gas vesicle protein n=1 Tax=Streptomyces griseolus TaxID=1909 RepID=UPI002243E885|nr:GvpL/GvpF family gas vesicle protein [Streptomyces griseolus]MCW8217388.1 GvpL/GvpF family gas vesicle protein [Streptomyces griseolus]
MTRPLPGAVVTPGGHPATTTATAIYVFAVCHGCDPAVLTGLAGQAAGAPVRLLRFGSLEAVVQDVPAEMFGEEALRERLADRAELEHCARAHHAVIAAAAGRAPTLPLPLATLYLSDERARAALCEDENRFRSVMGRIAGRVEWGVKVYAAPGRPPPTRPERTGPTTTAPTTTAPTTTTLTATAPPETTSAARTNTRPGHAYLDRARGARRAREERQEAGLNAAASVDRALRDIAVAGRRLRSHDTGVTGAGRVQLLNAAYLVDEGREADLIGAVELLRTSPGYERVELEVTGPWVPYSFVDGGDLDADQ